VVRLGDPLFPSFLPLTFLLSLHPFVPPPSLSSLPPAPFFLLPLHSPTRSSPLSSPSPFSLPHLFTLLSPHLSVPRLSSALLFPASPPTSSSLPFLSLFNHYTLSPLFPPLVVPPPLPSSHFFFASPSYLSHLLFPQPSNLLFLLPTPSSPLPLTRVLSHPPPFLLPQTHYPLSLFSLHFGADRDLIDCNRLIGCVRIIPSSASKRSSRAARGAGSGLADVWWSVPTPPE